MANAAPVDFVTLQQAQDYLGISTGSTAKLQSIIRAISMAMLGQMNRKAILPATYSDILDGRPIGIFLPNWPVQSVQSVSVSWPGFGSSTPILAAAANNGVGYVLDVPDDPPPGSPQMLSATPCGVMDHGTKVAVTYVAGYQITGEQQAVPGGGGNVTVAAPFGAWGSDCGVTDTSGNAFVAVSGSPVQGQYSVAAGVYTFSSADAGTAVLISYGYIPADLANACLEWVQSRMVYQDRIDVASKTLGGQETVSYRMPQVPTYVAGVLANYTNVVPLS